jgi:hypothetical protein
MKGSPAHQHADMARRIICLTRFLVLGAAFPVVLSAISYLGYFTNYTRGLFSRDSFIEQYSSGVYKYRLLGKEVLLQIHDLILALNLPTYAPKAMIQMDRHAEAAFYSAYFYLNTAALCIMCALLFLLFEQRKAAESLWRDLSLMFITAIIALSEYVITPYDVMSYMFLALAAYVMICRPLDGIWRKLALAVVVTAATATRETAVLILCLHFSIYHGRVLSNPLRSGLNKSQLELGLLVICFALTYIGLRFAFGFNHGVSNTPSFEPGAGPLPVLGLLFLVSTVGIVALSSSSHREIMAFLLSATPYIVLMLLVAVAWEVRLWVPVVMLMLTIRLAAVNQPDLPDEQTA